MATLATVFVVVLLPSLIPAFAPLTWMATPRIAFNIDHGQPFVYFCAYFVLARLTFLARVCAVTKIHGTLLVAPYKLPWRHPVKSAGEIKSGRTGR